MAGLEDGAGDGDANEAGDADDSVLNKTRVSNFIFFLTEFRILTPDMPLLRALWKQEQGNSRKG